MQAIAEEEIVVLPELTPLQKLAAVKAQIEDFDKQIKSDKKLYGITLLEEKMAEHQKEYDQLLAEIVPTLTFGEDKFLKALKKKGDSYREGSLKLIRSSTTRRKVLVEKFLATFPIEKIKKCCKIELGKADKAIGSDTMDEFVTKETTYDYELLDMTKTD